MITDEVLRGMWEIRLGIHGVNRCKFTIKPGEKLDHCTVGMSTNTIVPCSNFHEEGVSSECFFEAMYVGGRKARFEMLAEGVMLSGLVVLAGIV